jgi:ABC-type transporter Mla subunit MlaD
MTQANEPDPSNLEVNRQLRSLSRRVDRLEYSLISPQEFSRAFDRVYDEFDRVYDEIDGLETGMNQRFDRLEGVIGELNRKFDVIMQYITGQGGSPP